MRVPTGWRQPIDEGRLVLLSPFPVGCRRPTVPLAEQRNRLVADIARIVFVVHAAPHSKTAAFCRQLGEKGRPVWTFDSPAKSQKSGGARCFSSIKAVSQAFIGEKGEAGKGDADRSETNELSRSPNALRSMPLGSTA